MEDTDEKGSRFEDTARRSLILPVALILLFSVVTVATLVILGAIGQDEVAEKQSIRLARSALNEMEQNLAQLNRENAYWDQAVNNLVEKFDPVWADDNIGPYLAESAGISRTYVLDDDNRIIYGMTDGKRKLDHSLTRFPKGIETLVSRTRASSPPSDVPKQVVGFVRWNDDVFLASASVMTTYRYVNNKEITEATGHVLVLMKRLNEELLSRLEQAYLLPGLRLMRPEEPPQSLAQVPLTSVKGMSVGALGWSPEKPGSNLLRWVLPVIGIVFAAMVGLTLAFIYRANRFSKALIQEVADRKEAEWELARVKAQSHARKMESLGNMTGSIAHNFNNLLLPILTLSLTTIKTLPESSEERKDLEGVVEAAERARDLVRQIMAFSRADVPDRKIINICSAIEKPLELLRSTIPSTIKLTVDLDQEAGEVFADETQVQTMMMNLISNSVDAIDGKIGKIWVSLSHIEIDPRADNKVSDLEAGAYVKLTISDNGKGMDEATASRAFDPFFTTKKVGEGTGLGLSSAYGIVAQHGGTIHCSSKPGEGTTSEVYLPLADAERKNHP